MTLTRVVAVGGSGGSRSSSSGSSSSRSSRSISNSSKIGTDPDEVVNYNIPEFQNFGDLNVFGVERFGNCTSCYLAGITAPHML